MIRYAESSAVLAWLLGEEAGSTIRDHLVTAEAVFVSRLTLVECHRSLVRLVAGGGLPEGSAADLRAVLAGAAARWMLCEVTDAVLSRAGNPFPVEPIRTLDALHLATALEVRSADPRLEVLSLDQRVRANAHALGFAVVPAA